MCGIIRQPQGFIPAQDIKTRFVFEDKMFNTEGAQKEGLIGFLSQNPALVPWENVENNIQLPSKLCSKLSPPNRAQIIKEFNSIGLKEEDLNKFPHELSFGMQARVAIIRTLIYNPKFIFLDELFTGIDTINSQLIAAKIKSYITDNKSVCLSVTHDIERAIKISENILIFSKDRKLIKFSQPFDFIQIQNFLKNNQQ